MVDEKQERGEKQDFLPRKVEHAAHFESDEKDSDKN
jgi:hypothetical protein